jgi:hypothetical protein
MLFRLVFTLTGIAGAWKVWRGGSKSGLILLVLGCLSIAPYTMTQMCDRYTLPLNAMLLLPAAQLITLLFQHVRRSSPRAALKWAGFSSAMHQVEAASSN